LAEAVTANAMGSVERCTPAAAGAGRQAPRSTAASNETTTAPCRRAIAAPDGRLVYAVVGDGGEEPDAAAWAALGLGMGWRSTDRPRTNI